MEELETLKKVLVKDYVKSNDLTITTQPTMDTKLKDIRCLDLVKLTDDVALLFRYEDTHDDRMSGYKVPMYRCIHIITNGDFGYGDFQTYDIDSQTFNLVESDYDEIDEIPLQEREDNDTIGMLIIKHSGEILDALMQWKDRKLQRAMQR